MPTTCAFCGKQLDPYRVHCNFCGKPTASRNTQTALVLPQNRLHDAVALQDMLDKWMRSDALDKTYSFTPFRRAVPNDNIQAYKVQTPGGAIFVKVYFLALSAAEEEYRNYHSFQHLPFVPKLLYAMVTDQRYLFAYEFIEGRDLYRHSIVTRSQDTPPMRDILYQALMQIHQMRTALQTRKGLFSTHSWFLRPPMREKFLTPAAESTFLNDYEVVLARNAQAMQVFPGFYLDRTPRNVIYHQGQVYQVDLGVVEHASPLFDLAKLLRNGTDVLLPANVDLKAVKDTPDLVASLALYPKSEEQPFLDLLYEQIKVAAPISGRSRELFGLLYNYASIHTHLFYLIKYGKRLRKKKATGDLERLFSQCYYHFGTAFQVLDELEQMGEPVFRLRSWVEMFLQLVAEKQALLRIP